MIFVICQYAEKVLRKASHVRFDITSDAVADVAAYASTFRHCCWSSGMMDEMGGSVFGVCVIIFELVDGISTR